MNIPGIESLCFFESLRVGKLVVEPKRVKASYTLTLGSGKRSEQELIYTYAERVFQKNSESVNLASMIVAQVALNYGLFCREIIFDGLYEDADKRFIQDMMENTSREIYVNKFLMSNEFIVAPYNQLKAEKRKRYTAALVVFENTGHGGMFLDWKHSDADRQKFVILSSGGKDSLLSYGLLKELKKEVIPVFINESGRHWFSAINAHKHLSEADPNCKKVWCNSDRIYNWMLRQMPCIRKDFSDIRADIYPVRLWTVGVFIFGALPIARKTGAGNIIIGNEYDTTEKSSFEGITHYKALYDQSKYFDNALTRYYTKKGWNTFQFSMLRSLSEILILKILSHRYPELQAQQVSCHAASVKEARSYPCGKCEKCRRIVSMLTVLNESAEKCGYTSNQISEAILKTGSSGVKQIGSDAQHLYFMLLNKNLISKETASASHAREHPYIMKMRFDNRRSALNDMPVSLYKQLIPIYMEYTGGAVERRRSQWVSMDISSELENAIPYPFEISEVKNTPSALKSSINWESYTWKEMENRLKEVDTAILPCGSIEQHGPHLPLDVDYYDSIYLARTVAEACSSPKPLVIPAIPYGVAYHHEDFKGTISVSNNTLATLVYDIGMSLVRNGIRKLIILNAHGDNAPTLLYAAQMINRDSGIFVCVESGETSDTDLSLLTDTPNDIHAGEIETSTTLALRPEVVKMEEAVDETMDFGNTYFEFTSDRGVPWYVRTKIISASGIMGNPLKADASKGKKMWEIMVAHLVGFVEEVKKSNLEDLFQRRY